MANLKNINLMSQDTFESITPADDELYAVSASGIGFPSNRYEDLTLGASGTEYTAPANGYFNFNKDEAANQYLIMYNVTKKYGSTDFSAGGQIKMIFPVQKNDVVQVNWAGSGTLVHFRFIYAEGE